MKSWRHDTHKPVSAMHQYAKRLRDQQNHATALSAHEQTLRLEQIDALMHQIVEDSFDGILTVDENGLIQTANAAACRIFQCNLRELLKSEIETFVPHFAGLRDPHSVTYAVGRGHQETTARRLGEQLFPIDICISRIASSDTPSHILIVRDITELRQNQAILEHQALHDALTGLPNRTLLKDRMQQAISSARRSGHLVALFLLDLDRFKQINDTLGHHIGDLLLKDLAKRLLMPVRATDTVARLGGDEFAILLPSIETQEFGIELAERVLAVFEKPFEVQENLQLHVNCSIGVAFFPIHTEDPHRLMQCADVAMYAAKGGAERIIVYDSTKDSNSVRRLRLSTELRNAITDDEQLSMVYQPKIDLKSQMICGVEALCRWRHPHLGLVPPDEFVQHAEQTGAITELTRWTFEAALCELARWSVGGFDLSLAINLSARMLHDESIPQLLASIARSYNLDPTRIIIEITESAIVLDPLTARKNACHLADAGFELAIDDYGTGYSSLSALQSLPIRELKIDRSFVLDMLANPASDVIVRSTVDLAHNLGMRVVAEGVETREHFNRLRQLYADIAQGYFISIPLNGRDFLNFLDSRPVQKLLSVA